MDYRSEVTAFNGQLESGTMSACEISLWHALHDVAILCGHSDALSLATVTLTVRTGFSRSAIIRARDALRDKGYLDYKIRGSNRATLYWIKSVYHPDTQDATQHATQDATQHATQDATRRERLYTTTTTLVDNHKSNGSSPYISAHPETQDATQRDTHHPWISDAEAAAIVQDLGEVLDAMAYIGMPSTQSDYDRANELTAQYGKEWMLEAIRRAGLRDQKARNWRFVDGILKSWKDKGGIDEMGKPKEPATTGVKFADLRR